MNTQHMWIMTQVPPFEAVIMSKPILFWRMAFLIKDISVFSEDMLCWLSFTACWVNSVRASICAITSSRTMEGTEMADLNQWKTECAVWP